MPYRTLGRSGIKVGACALRPGLRRRPAGERAAA